MSELKKKKKKHKTINQGLHVTNLHQQTNKMSVSHSNIVHIQFSLCRKLWGAFLHYNWSLVIQARKGHASHWSVQSCQGKNYNSVRCCGLSLCIILWQCPHEARHHYKISQLWDILETLNTRASPLWLHPALQSSSCCLPVWNSGCPWRNSCNLLKTRGKTLCYDKKISKVL